MNKKIKQIFILGGLGLVLLLTLVLVRQRQELRRGAVLSTASILVQPEVLKMTKGGEGTVHVFLDPKGAKLAAYDLYYCYDPAIASFVPGSIKVLKDGSGNDIYKIMTSLTTVKTDYLPNKSCLRIVAMVDPYTYGTKEQINGVVITENKEILSFNMKGVAEGKTSLNLDLSKTDSSAGRTYSYLSGYNPDGNDTVIAISDASKNPISVEVAPETGSKTSCGVVDGKERFINDVWCRAGVTATVYKCDSAFNVIATGCGTNEQCVNGACEQKPDSGCVREGITYTTGQKVCVGVNTYLTCQSNNSFGAIEACGTSEQCSNGQCVATKTSCGVIEGKDRVAGETWCKTGETSTYYICNVNFTASAVGCATDQQCANGVCVAIGGPSSCVRDGISYTPGQKVCIGVNTYVQCQTDNSFSTVQACGTNEQCSNGQCETKPQTGCVRSGITYVYGQKVCLGATSYQECQTNNSFGTVKYCSTGSQCSSGDCKPVKQECGTIVDEN